MSKKRLALLFGIIIVLILGIWGKVYMDKQTEKERKEYVEAVKETQEEASKYIIENYSGIETIEWNGWSTDNHTLLYSGPKGVDTSMTINGYEDEVNGKVQLGYSALNPEWIKKYTDSVLDNDAIIDGKTQENKFKKIGVKKDAKGSPNAKIIYNLKENK